MEDIVKPEETSAVGNKVIKTIIKRWHIFYVSYRMNVEDIYTTKQGESPSKYQQGNPEPWVM